MTIPKEPTEIYVDINSDIISFFNGGELSSDLYFFPMLEMEYKSILGYQYLSIQDDQHPLFYLKLTLCVLETGGYSYEMFEDHACFVKKFKDSFSPDFLFFVFDVPGKWKLDFERILQGRFEEISTAYRKQVYRIFPNGIESLKKKQNSMVSNVEVKYGRKKYTVTKNVKKIPNGASEAPCFKDSIREEKRG